MGRMFARRGHFDMQGALVATHVRSKELNGHLLALGSAVCGSLVFVAIKVAREELGPVSLFLLRNNLALLLVLALWTVRPPRMGGLGSRLWLALVLIALLHGPVYQIILNVGAVGTSVGLIAVLAASIPLHVTWMGALLLRERIGVRRAGSVGLAFIGATLPFVTQQELNFTSLVYPLMVLASALVGGAFVILGRTVVQRLGAWEVTTSTVVIAACVCLPMHTPRIVGQWVELSARGWLAVGYLAVGMLITMGLMFAALRRLQAVTTSLYQFAQMLLASMWGLLILSEPVGWAMAFASVLIAVGLALNVASSSPRVACPCAEVSASQLTDQ